MEPAAQPRVGPTVPPAATQAVVAPEGTSVTTAHVALGSHATAGESGSQTAVQVPYVVPLMTSGGANDVHTKPAGQAPAAPTSHTISQPCAPGPCRRQAEPGTQ